MNHIRNDYGLEVVAVGMPNSDADIKNRYPKLLSEITSKHRTYYHSSSAQAYLLVTQLLERSKLDKVTQNRILEVANLSEFYTA